jgi:HNH endonuclease
VSADGTWESKSKPPRELKVALGLLVDNRDDEAFVELKEIVGHPEHRASRRQPPREVQIARLYQDSFSCAHCGKALVPLPVLKAASLFWPDALPFHTSFAAGSTHPLYLQFAATFDHVHPLGFGGVDKIENVRTSCWTCNVSQGPFFLEHDRVRAAEPRHPKWHGLVPQYLQLESRLRALSTDQWNRVHRLWMRDLQAAERSAATAALVET